MADLADPDADLALRRRLLSGVGLARLDAGDRDRFCRRPTCSKACGRWSPASPPPWDRLALGGGLAVVYLVLACVFFFAIYRYAIRTGLIARYSAETVS